MKIAVLAGGASAEAEVSRSSAAGVADALGERGHQVVIAEVDAALVDALRAFKPDVVFPMLHGPPGEDGTIQGLLAMLGLPFVGSGVHGCAVAMDKHVTKTLLRGAGLPVADDVHVPRGADAAGAAAEIRARLGERVVVKPLRQGSALGLTPLPEGGDLAAALGVAAAFGDGVLVERFVRGREVTVGVLDEHGAGPVALPAIEITVAAGEWYDYRNRYTPGRSRHAAPDLPEDQLRALQRHAVDAHRCLGLRDLSRADFVVGEAAGKTVILEVNALPGMTPTSLYPDACRMTGLAFPELTERLALSALRRGPEPLGASSA